jgi:iron complex outermembrane receptor protein
MRSLLLLGSIGLCLAASLVRAQEILEDVVVTAERRTENIRDVPVAISAFSGEELAVRNISSLQDLKLIAPSVQIGSDEGTSTKVRIRGIGSFSGEEPAVAQIQDGMPYSTEGYGNLGGLGNVSFLDVDRVEVLRGPQGTLGGRNATAGGIYVNSKQPTDTFQASIKGEVGNLDYYSVEGVLSGPIVADALSARLAVRTKQSDGWIENTTLGEDLYGIDQREGRLSLLSRPTDNFSALLIVQADQNRGRQVSVAFGRARPDQPSIYEVLGAPIFDFDSNTLQMDETTSTDQKRWQGILRLNLDLGFGVLSSISGYVKRTVHDTYDEDASLIPTGIVGPDPFHSDAWQWSQELTLVADLGSRSDLIVGGLYTQNERFSEVDLGLPYLGIPAGQLYINDLKTLQSYGLYAQLRYRFTDQLRLTAGARYVNDRKTGSGMQDAFEGLLVQTSYNDGDWGATTPRVSFDWQPNEDLTLYVAAVRGFKSGGIEMSSFPANRYEPEYVWNYESGIKFSSFEERLHGAVTAFYMDYTNMQQTLAGLEPGVIAFRTVNAAKATIKGVELTLDAHLTTALHLTAAATYLDTEYDSLQSFDPLYPELGTPVPGGGLLPVRDLSGNQLAGAPQWQYNVSGDYTIPFGEKFDGVLRAAYSWVDDAPGDFYNHPNGYTPSYGVLDVSAGIQARDGRWRITAYGENVSDERYLIARSGSDGFSTGLWTSLYVFGDPRRYGLRLEASF